MSRRFDVWFVCGWLVLAMAAGEVLAAGPTVSRVEVSSSAPPFVGCSPSSLQANVQAVSNDGIVGGYVTSKLGTGGCLPRVFRWNNGGFTIVPFPPMPPNTNAVGGRIAVISTNNVTGGITFECQGAPRCPSPFEAATASGPATQTLIKGWNYVFGISENGTWITGTNLGGQPLLYNVTTGKPVTLTLKGAAMVNAALSSVSDAGLAVGFHLDPQRKSNNGMICTSSGACQEIDMGTSSHSALVKSISSNGTYIYGFHAYGQNRNVLTAITKNSSGAYVAIETPLHYVIFPRTDVTDKGTLVATARNSYYFVVPGPNTPPQNNYTVYTVASLIAKLGLGANVPQSSIALSPNGKYISFNVPVTSAGATTLIGYRVYFESGIESYLKSDLSPIEPMKK